MTETLTAQADTWGDAFDSRRAAIRAHPDYPQLFIKTARYAAISYYARSPIRHHYRASRGRDAFFIGDHVWYRRWSQTLIKHPDESYPQRQPHLAMKEIAEKIELDVYTDEERARANNFGDRLASVWCTALDDVQARVDGRRQHVEGCMICGKPAAVDVQAPVTLHGQGAPAGRKAYPPMRIQLCVEHVEQYHR